MFASHGQNGFDSSVESPVASSPYTPVSGSEEGAVFYEVMAAGYEPAMVAQEPFQCHPSPQQQLPPPTTSVPYYEPDQQFSTQLDHPYHSASPMMDTGYMTSADTLSAYSLNTSHCVPQAAYQDTVYYSDHYHSNQNLNNGHPYCNRSHSPANFSESDIEQLEQVFCSSKRISQPQKNNLAVTLRHSVQSIDRWLQNRRAQEKRKTQAFKPPSTKSSKKRGDSPQADYSPDPMLLINKEKAQESLQRFIKQEVSPGLPPSQSVYTHDPLLSLIPVAPLSLSHMPLSTQLPQHSMAIGPNGMLPSYASTPAIMVPVAPSRTPVPDAVARPEVRRIQSGHDLQSWDQYMAIGGADGNWRRATAPGFGGMHFQ